MAKEPKVDKKAREVKETTEAKKATEDKEVQGGLVLCDVSVN